MRECHSIKRLFFVALLVINIMLSGTVLILEIVERCSISQFLDQYTLYIGTNDKDTNRQEISFDECKARVENVCLQYVSGFTITEANGVWIDDAGTIFKENTLVCCINGATAAEIDLIVDQLLLELNQSSIMVENQKLSCTYHSH